jgi:hypothetical protein
MLKKVLISPNCLYSSVLRNTKDFSSSANLLNISKSLSANAS